MSRSNSWIFGLIFLAAFVYVGWNGFEFPKFILGKTNITTGKIVNTFHHWGVKGKSYQRVKFIYSVNDSIYFDFMTIGKKYGSQNIGNRVRIEYSINKPEKNKVIGFFNDYQNSQKEKYHTNENTGYSEISLINGLYDFTEYGKQGIVLQEIRGEYKIKSDSLILESFDKRNRMYFIITGLEGNRNLKDCKTKKVFTN